MVLEWVRDTETFKFKTIYKIETSLVMIEILCDDVDNRIVDGKIVVRTEVFKKITDSELLTAASIEEAQIYMLEKTLGNCDSITLPDSKTSLPQDELKQIFNDIYDTYMHQLAKLHVKPEVITFYGAALAEVEMLKEFEAMSKEPLPFDKLTLLRQRLIHEEFNEIKDALIEKNVIHVAKEICDLKYVCYGTLLSFNLDLDELMYYASWNFFAKEIEGSTDIIFSGIKALERCIQEFDTALEVKTFNNYRVAKTLLNCLAIMDYCCNKFVFPIHDCFKEVHRSNMSKFGPDGAVRNEYGKIVKGENYSPADLNRFFDNYP